MGAFKIRKTVPGMFSFGTPTGKGNVSKNSSEDLRPREKRRNGNVNF